MSLMSCLGQHICPGQLVKDAYYALIDLLSHMTLAHFNAHHDILLLLTMMHRSTLIELDARTKLHARGEIVDRLDFTKHLGQVKLR